MEIRQLRIFLAAADELHFSRAADRLHVPQSVVSEQIKRLEIELGVKLFDRSRRNVRLTPAGETLVGRGEEILASVQRFMETAQRHSEGPAVQRLGIGIGSGLGRRLPSILRYLVARGVPVQPVDTSPAERTAMLHDGRLDAAIIRGRVTSTTLWRSHVWSERLVAAMPVQHPLARREHVTLTELSRSPVALVQRDLNPALHDLLNGALTATGRTLKPGIPFTTVESTFAELAVHPTPMWTPVFEGYEAEHPYDGIRAIPIEPLLAFPAFLVVAAHVPDETRDLILAACASTAGNASAPAPKGAAAEAFE